MSNGNHRSVGKTKIALSLICIDNVGNSTAAYARSGDNRLSPEVSEGAAQSKPVSAWRSSHKAKLGRRIGKTDRSEKHADQRK